MDRVSDKAGYDKECGSLGEIETGRSVRIGEETAEEAEADVRGDG